MSFPFRLADQFDEDFDRQYRWYFENASETVANDFLNALKKIDLVSSQPEIGARQRFKHPKLKNLRSFRVEIPFNKILLFYRIEQEEIEFWRLMHGARDLPRRLTESPE